MSAINQKNKAVVWDFWQRMNFAEPNQVAGLVNKTFHKDVDWNGPQPINQIRGTDALITDFWEPLRHSFPDIKRTADILMGGDSKSWTTGESTGEDWVSGIGYLTGTFVHDWLGIPATGKKTNIHFGQFFLMRDEKVAESYVVLDVLAVMKQAGFQVLPPALGQEGGKVLKPYGGAGVLLTEQDELEGRQTFQACLAMLNGLVRYVRSRDMENLDSMEQHLFWHPDFHWMGPTGIGSTHGLEEFNDFHDRPWLIGFGDRTATRDFEPKGGRDLGAFGEGQFACLGGWDVQFSRHHGEYQGVPATEKIMSIRDFDWYKCEGGLPIQNWIPIDIIDLFLQLDVDLFDRMKRQIELRNLGIEWFDIQAATVGAGDTKNLLAAISGTKF
jgi:hypothetical protein